MGSKRSRRAELRRIAQEAREVSGSFSVNRRAKLIEDPEELQRLSPIEREYQNYLRRKVEILEKYGDEGRRYPKDWSQETRQELSRDPEFRRSNHRLLRMIGEANQGSENG